MVGERWVCVSSPCSVSRLVGSGVWGLLRLRDQGRLLRRGSAELSPKSGKILLERRREMKFQKDEQMDKGLEAWKPCGSLSWRDSWKVRPGRAVKASSASRGLDFIRQRPRRAEFQVRPEFTRAHRSREATGEDPDSISFSPSAAQPACNRSSMSAKSTQIRPDGNLRPLAKKEMKT